MAFGRPFPFESKACLCSTQYWRLRPIRPSWWIPGWPNWLVQTCSQWPLPGYRLNSPSHSRFKLLYSPSTASKQLISRLSRSNLASLCKFEWNASRLFQGISSFFPTVCIRSRFSTAVASTRLSPSTTLGVVYFKLTSLTFSDPSSNWISKSTRFPAMLSIFSCHIHSKPSNFPSLSTPSRHMPLPETRVLSRRITSSIRRAFSSSVSLGPPIPKADIPIAWMPFSLIPGPVRASFPAGDGVIPPKPRASSADGELNATASSTEVGAAMGVGYWCEEILGWCPWPEAEGVLIDGDLWESGRPMGTADG
ncbi:hypothetical protein ACKS0A_07614 [Histoplasma ohiense]